MLKRIKNYELNPSISIEVLEQAKFNKEGVLDYIPKPKLCFYEQLKDDVFLAIEIPTNENSIDFNNFNDERNICVYDEDVNANYIPFYNSKHLFPYLDEVIENYNIKMNMLVEQGIFKEKVKEYENKI